MAGRGGTVTVIFLGDAKQLDDTLAHVAASTDATADKVGAAGEKAGTKFGEGIDKGTSKLGSIFSKLGEEAGNFGLPFSSQLTKIGNDLNNVETKGKGFKEAFTSIGAVGVAALAGVALESVHLADGFDRAQAALETAVKNSGASWGQYKGQVADAAKTSGALVTGNADEVDSALQELTTATRSPATALKDLGLVEDIAAMKHISLADAAQGLVKVYGGSTRILQQWGINLDIGSDKLKSIQSAEEAVQSATLKLHTVQAEVNDGQIQGAAASAGLASANLSLRNANLNLKESQQALPDIMAELKSRTNGAAAAFGKTLPGELTIAKNSIHNLGIEFGEFLLPAIDKILGTGARIIAFLQRNKDFAIALGVAIGGPLVAAMLTFAGTAAVGAISALGNIASSLVSTASTVVSRAATMGTSFLGIGADAKAMEATTATAMDGAAVTTEVASKGIMAAIGSTGIGLVIIGLGIGITELMTHWNQAWPAMKTAAVDVANFIIDNVINPLISGFDRLVNVVTAGIVQLHGELSNVSTGQQNYSVNTRTASVALPHGTTAAQAKQIQSDVNKGMTVAAAEKAVLSVASSMSDLNTMTKAQETEAKATLQAAIIGEKGLTGLALAAQKAQVTLDRLEANPKATQQQIANATATLTIAQAKASANGPGTSIPPLGGSPTVSGGAPAGFMTPGDIALESVAKTFQGQLTRSGQGGTGITQQAQTVASIRAALAHTGQETTLINSLNAAKNPTLTGLAQSIETTWSGLANKLATIVDTDTKAGQSEIQKLQSAASSTSIDTLRSAVTGQAATSFNQLTTELTAVHSKALDSLVTSLKANWATTISDYNQVIATLGTIAKAAGAEMAAQVTGARTTQLANVGAAAVGLSGLQSQQLIDSINNQVTQINDTAKVQEDYAAETVQAIQATTTAIQQAASSQVSTIQDSTQTQVDILGQRGLYGLALIAQQAKIQLDQQKAIDDANINAATAHLDQVTAQTNAAVARAQTNADMVQQQQDAAVAATQANADATAINGAILAAASQAQVDSQAIVNAIQVGTATAHADASQYSTSNIQAQAQAAEQLAQGQADHSAAQMAMQQQVTTNAINAANQNASNAYNQAQAYASQQEAIANAQLASAQSNANVQQALASQQLASIQSQAAITEAKLTSIYNVDQELAQVEYAGSGVSVYITGIPADNAAAIGAAASYALRYKAS